MKVHPISDCYAYASFELIIFSAPCVIISRSSSLFAVTAGRYINNVTRGINEHVLFDCCWWPCWMTSWSSRNFWAARSSIRSSTLSSATRRNTYTCFVCPIRWARSMAWRSACGFLKRIINEAAKKCSYTTHQSLSYKTTMSAVVRLIPSPPARVVRRKINRSLPGLLYSSIATIRSSWGVLPSIRQYSTSISTSKRTQVIGHTVASKETIVLQDVQYPTHLAENEYTWALCLH